MLGDGVGQKTALPIVGAGKKKVHPERKAIRKGRREPNWGHWRGE